MYIHQESLNPALQIQVQKSVKSSSGITQGETLQYLRTDLSVYISVRNLLFDINILILYSKYFYFN